MTKKPTGPPSPAGREPKRDDESVSPGVSEAIRALREATDALAASTTSATQAPTAFAAEPPPTPSTPSATGEPQESSPPRPSPYEHDQEARVYYERLEQAGQLMDVTDDTDLSKLPPRITHVRQPDGTIRRIGFS